MTDDDLTGPWVLALGALALGVGAVAAEALRQRRADSEDSTDRTDPTDSADRTNPADRGDRTDRGDRPPGDGAA